ncbi:hypothetical protein [Longibacter sp.]|uniref:hypothetical protein n=1 Tax=Longibacter sp. TaxID=2045415 RepID=UPI003EBB66B5
MNDPETRDVAEPVRMRMKDGPGDVSTSDAPLFSYFAYGLRLGCTMQLPELETCSSSESLGPSSHDVEIRRADLPAIPAELAERAGLAVRARKDSVHFIWPRSGQFVVRSGRSVRYAPMPGVTEETLRAPLLGVVLGTLLHQRGLHTLHASAVVIDECAVAFVGEKGAGKSTTATALHERGHSLVTDDVLALDVSKTGAPMARPAFPRVKLWPDTLQMLGRDPASLARVTRDIDKRVHAPERCCRRAVPLSRIYLLQDGPEVSETRLSEREAFFELMSHSYAARFLGAKQAGRQDFRLTQALVAAVPVIRLGRPRSFAHLDRVLSTIEEASSTS